ncbi:MAG: hypothetical protein KC457_07255, partial [Myxococcales bacterium]|nr:hypothetical protein [Myxococcales bacterium]
FDDPVPRRRWLRLLVHALHDLLKRVDPRLVHECGFILVLPPGEQERPRSPEEVARAISELRLDLDPRKIEVVTTTSTSVAHHALIRAGHHLAQSRYACCVVAAADSLIDGRILLDLADSGRLLTPLNSDGMTPGEAAACLLLQPSPHGAIAIIRGLGIAQEPGTLWNDVPLRGDGMVTAVRHALTQAGLHMHDLDFRISDATGEGYHFREQLLLLTRMLRQRKVSFPLWLTAASLGHVGVAAGPCGLVQAIVAHQRGYAPGPFVLETVSADDGERAAAVLELRSCASDLCEARSLRGYRS